MTEEQPTLTTQGIRDAFASLSRDAPAFGKVSWPLHPFQWADMCIQPKGWFSRLLWRFMRWHYVTPNLPGVDVYISKNIEPTEKP